MKRTTLFYIVVITQMFFLNLSKVFAQEELPYFLKDRGNGIATSMFGTYINKGEFIIYPYYEYYYDNDKEYKPKELGYNLDKDFFGRYRAHEWLIFFGYGITDRLAVEFETAVITATQYKSKKDTSNMPPDLNESGFGDTEFQLRWRWTKETENRPEIFSYYETVFPFQKNRKLIGTKNWELKLGTGLTKGFNFGTLTVKLSAEYTTGENKLELGGYAVEYLKRVSKLFRFYLGVEGVQDEVEFIADLQFHLLPYAFIRINNAFGVTTKATDYAPEVGVSFRF
jgi:hypothetical protein